VKRLVRLPAFWSLLSDAATEAKVHEYAADQSKFHADFASAFEKVVNRGQFTDSLAQCKALNCTAGDDNELVCTGDSSSVTLQTDKCLCQADGSNLLAPCEAAPPIHNATCKLIGGFGMRGKIECMGAVYACPSLAGQLRETEACTQKATWGVGGCPSDTTPVPPPATPVRPDPSGSAMAGSGSADTASSSSAVSGAAMAGSASVLTNLADLSSGDGGSGSAAIAQPDTSAGATSVFCQPITYGASPPIVSAVE